MQSSTALKVLFYYKCGMKEKGISIGVMPRPYFPPSKLPYHLSETRIPYTLQHAPQTSSTFALVPFELCDCVRSGRIQLSLLQTCKSTWRRNSFFTNRTPG